MSLSVAYISLCVQATVVSLWTGSAHDRKTGILVYTRSQVSLSSFFSSLLASFTFYDYTMITERVGLKGAHVITKSRTIRAVCARMRGWGSVCGGEWKVVFVVVGGGEGGVGGVSSQMLYLPCTVKRIWYPDWLVSSQRLVLFESVTVKVSLTIWLCIRDACGVGYHCNTDRRNCTLYVM